MVKKMYKWKRMSMYTQANFEQRLNGHSDKAQISTERFRDSIKKTIQQLKSSHVCILLVSTNFVKTMYQLNRVKYLTYSLNILFKTKSNK